MVTSATLSVIIPVYNTEEYLERCLESVINQSYRHLEIIIINDGSTDNSLEIIKKYCSFDPRCKYINIEENTGVGNARNTGVDISSGKYIAFIDSDDWIDTNFYMELVTAIESDNSDIAVAGIKTEYNNAKTSRIRYQYKYNNIITNRFALKVLTNEMSQDIYVSPIVNNKVYRSALIKESELRFDCNRRAQDNYFSFLILTKANSISLVSNVYYHYYQRSNSATHRFSKRYIDDWADILLSIKNYLVSFELYDIYSLDYMAFAERCLSSILKMLFNCINDEKEQKESIKYIFNRCKEFLDIDIVIDYIDSERIRRFFE